MTNLKTLTATTALTAAALLASSMAHAQNALDHPHWVSSDGIAVGVFNYGTQTTDIFTNKQVSSLTTTNASVPTGSTLNVHQPNTSSIFVVTEVSNPAQTVIDGNIWSNGSVRFLDVNGVLIGSNAVIDMQGFAAVGGELVGVNDLDLTADVTIQAGANIQIGNGVAAFLGNSVINNGDIVSTGTGSILLAAGETATVDLYGDNLVSLAVSGDGEITHNGTIEAARGKVYMTAARAEDIVNTVINIDGIVNASTANLVNGEIILTADTVNINEDLTANTKITVNAITTNLDARLKNASGVDLDQTKTSGTATTVNVLSNDASIQQGINIAATGGTVNVSNDTYTENVALRKSINLVGQSNTNTTLNGTFRTVGNPGNITINNFNIVGNGTYGIRLTSNGRNFSILNNRFTSNNVDGVYIQYANGTVLVQDNYFANQNDGIEIYQPASWYGIIDGNRFSNNRVGIRASAFTDAEITDNTFNLNSGQTGINASWYNNLLIDGNEFYGNRNAGALGSVGINIEAHSNTTVTDNYIDFLYIGFATDNDSYGIKDGYLDYAGNTHETNYIGSWFKADTIDLTGAANTYNNTIHTAMVFGLGNQAGEGDFIAPLAGPSSSTNNLNLVNDTIGETVFNNTNTYFVYLQNGALFNPGTPTLLDGTQASFNGVIPANTDLTTAQADAIEIGIFHYRDLDTLGLFDFSLESDAGGVQPAGIDNIEDFLSQIDPSLVPGGAVNLTITGLPLTGFETPTSLNDISPAAGGDETNPDALNQLETAAGGEGSSTNCMNNALDSASNGQATTYSFESYLTDDTIEAENSCTQEL